MKARLPLLAALSVTVFAVAGMACNRSGTKLRDAASADLNCPPHEVHIIGASRTKDVTACGQQATYKFENGDWVMVSRSGSPPAGGKAPAAVKAGPPGVAPAQPATTVTGTPSMPPSSPPPPSQPPAAGQKAL